MKHDQKAIIAGFLLVLLITGCAATTTGLKEEDIRAIRKLAIVTVLEDQKLQILDRTGIKQQSWTDGQLGLLGALVEGLIVETVANAKIRGSLGGEPNLLRYEVSDVPIKELFDESFHKAFSIGCEIISPQVVDSLRMEHEAEKEKPGGEKAPDAIAPYKELGVNTILKIEFIYGLAVYAGGVRPSAVIKGRVSVADIEKEKVLLAKTISSDSYYKKAYTIDEFKADGAELFKKELAEATWALAYLVASEFDVELSRKERSYWRENE
jgi:hypothetical protein